MTVGIAFVRLLLGIAGSTSLAFSQLATAQEPISVKVLLDHHTNYPNWTLRYEFQQPIYAFAFTRQDGGFRSDQWSTLPSQTGESALVFAEGKTDIVRSANGVDEFKQANLLVPFESNNSNQYGYQFIQKFQGRSRAVFSEHFAISVWIKKNGTIEQRPANLEFTFVPHVNERLIVLSREGTSALTWSNPAGTRGIYLYFGRERLRKINGFNFLFDRGLPRKVTAYLSKNLSGILDFYHMKLGALDFKPVIFVRHVPATPGYEHGASGDALPGIFLMRIYGNGYLNKGDHPEDFEPVAWVAAHESAHMWNAIQHEDSSVSYWTWEGNAESMQIRALKALSLVTSPQFEKINEGYKTKCISTLKEKSLSQTIQLMLNWSNHDQPNPYGRIHYDCGAYLESLSEKVIEANGGDLFDLWRSLYEVSNQTGRKYSANAYFENLTKLSKKHEAADILRSFPSTTGAELQSLEMKIDELLK